MAQQFDDISDELGGTRKLDLKNLGRRQEQSDDTINENARELGLAHGATGALPKPAAQRVSWALQIPGYLDAELRRRAADADGETKTSLIIKALHQAGYQVEPEDLVGDRRRRKI